MAHTFPISQATSSRALSPGEPSTSLGDFASLWAHSENGSQDTSNLGDFGELWRFLRGEKEKWCNAGSTNLLDVESILASYGQPTECKQPPLLPHSSSSEYSSEEEKVGGYVVVTVDKGNKKATTKKSKKSKKGANAQESQLKQAENIKTIDNTDVIKKVHFNDVHHAVISSSNQKPQETALMRESPEAIFKSNNAKAAFKFRIPIPISISDDPIHVFIDNSNILMGFLAHFRQQQSLRRTQNSQAVLGKKTKPMLEYDALFTILERGRNIARRVLVASSPLYQQLNKAEKTGYEVSVLQRVKRNIFDDINTQQLDITSDNHPFEMEKEQCVDELIHLKILESLLDYHAPATLVLASGDGKDAEYFQGGFHKCVIKALERGWKVEVISWQRQLSANFLNKKFLKKWQGLYHVVFLDWFAKELGCEM